ncbi:MAG: TolC family protein [Flavihumibacter sp.]
MPQVSGAGSLTYNPLLQMVALPGELAGQPGQSLLVAFGQKWNANTAISLSQNIFDKSVFTALKAAKTTREYYQVLGGVTDEQLIEQVANNYYQVMVQQQKLAVIDSNIANSQRVFQVIYGMFQNGLAKKIDLDRTRVNIANLQAQRQQLLNGVQIQANTLKFLMGMNITDSIHLPTMGEQSIRPDLSLLAETPDAKQRIEYQLLKKQEQLLVYQKENVKSANYPSLSLSGNYGYQGLGNKFPVFKGASQGVNWFDYASVGLNLKVPLFTGFGNRARIRQAEVDIKKIQEDLRDKELSLNLAFENAKTQLRNAVITLQNQERDIDLAQEVFENTKNNYNQGLASLTDLLDAENALTTSRNNYAAALLDYRLAELQVIKSQGKLKSLLN